MKAEAKPRYLSIIVEILHNMRVTSRPACDTFFCCISRNTVLCLGQITPSLSATYICAMNFWLNLCGERAILPAAAAIFPHGAAATAAVGLANTYM